MGSQNISPALCNLANSPELTGAAKEILGEDVDFFHSKLMMKAALQGSFTPWHADWAYWQTIFSRPAQVNVFLAISAANIENGYSLYSR